MEYYDEIRKDIINAELYKKIKKYLTNANMSGYYQAGKLLIEASNNFKEDIIKIYSNKLMSEKVGNYTYEMLIKIKTFSEEIENLYKSLSNIAAVYFVDFIKLQSINHYYKYLNLINEYNLSIMDLRMLIRKDCMINKKINHIEKDSLLVKKIVVNDVNKNVLKLSDNFSFIGYDYNIKIGDRNNALNILLYNYIFNSFVVMSLKLKDLKQSYYLNRHLEKNSYKTLTYKKQTIKIEN